jgi:hypothetical protein
VLEAKVDKSEKEYLSLSLSLFLSFATCLSGFTPARILLKERARSDDDDDRAFDRENRGGCL